MFIALFMLTSHHMLATEAMKQCPSAVVSSLMLLHDPESVILKENASNRAPRPRVTIVRHSDTASTLLAIGPVLGSMDSRDVIIDLACTDDGVTLTATIVRSDAYSGALHKNVLWRPRITAEIKPRRHLLLRVKWCMQRTNGETVAQAATPPYSLQRYPIVLSKVLRVSHATP
jgi:hypothetical protein